MHSYFFLSWFLLGRMVQTIEYATLIILDVGKNVSAGQDCKDKVFFESAKQCALRIIERNILIKTRNHVGLILLGSNKTKSALAEQCKGAFKHIEMKSPLQIPTWDMIRSLPESTTSCAGDWFESLIVAAHHFKEEVYGVKINSKKIVLITNFESQAKVSTMFDDVVAGYQEENFEVYVIGPDLEVNNSKDIDLVRRFITETNGDTATFEEAMSGWLFHKTKSGKIKPQNFDLNIGPDISIPVAVYIRIRDDPVVKNWQKAIKDPVTLQASTTEGVKWEKKIIGSGSQPQQGDDNKPDVTPKGKSIQNPFRYSKDDIIQGYQYGQKVIPFSDSDKNMLYKSGDKSISLYGFTEASNINWQNLHGDGTYYVIARREDKKAQYAVTCLVQCLQELNLVGIVRKVFSKASEPKMYVLFPVVDSDNIVGFSLINICYKEEIKHMAFPPTELKQYNTSDEQVNAFKDLITAMDLMKAYDDNFDDAEAFPIAETVSPSIQYMLDCIAFRAMYPDKPLPRPRDEIMNLFKVPPLLEERSRDPVEKLKNLFTLTKVEPKKWSKKRRSQISNDAVPQNNPMGNCSTDQNMPQVQLPILKRDDITTIGTVTPVNDFNILKEKGKSLHDLSAEITEVIENLVYTNFGGDFTKALDAMKVFRDECVREEPSHYNNWILKFKKDLLERKSDKFLGLISEKKLNFIIQDENNASVYTGKDIHDESQMYDVDTIPNSTELTMRSDVNDFFDEM